MFQKAKRYSIKEKLGQLGEGIRNLELMAIKDTKLTHERIIEIIKNNKRVMQRLIKPPEFNMTGKINEEKKGKDIAASSSADS
jgi:hypothetical protein